MRFVVLVNDPFELKASMATSLFAWRLAVRGHTSILVGVEGLSWGTGDRLRVRGVAVTAAPSAQAALTELDESPETVIDLEAGDVLLMRTNPARDPERAEIHRAALGLARIAREQGVTVLNDPDVIERVGNKLYMLELPANVRPRQVVSAGIVELLAFARSEEGPIVIKPLWGTRGVGVQKIDIHRDGTRALVEGALSLLDQGPVVAQEYLLDAPAGDTRVLMLEGEVIEVDGRRAAVRRVPKAGEFRSNVHLGASAAPARWTEGLADTIQAVGIRLVEDGVFLAGVDVVGDKIVEVNAFAPGGFLNAQQFEAVDFIGAVLDAVQERAGLDAS